MLLLTARMGIAVMYWALRASRHTKFGLATAPKTRTIRSPLPEGEG